MGFALFFIPAFIFGILAGMNSVWWLLIFLVWEYTLGNRYAEMVNGGPLRSSGIGVFILDFVVLLVCFVLSFVFLPNFSLSDFFSLLHRAT